MAKRFTDTNKLKKKWLRGLKAPYKLLWVYLLDSCDHAGIWEVDFEIANIYIGGGVSEENAKKILKDKIHIFDNGEKWLIIDFIGFQYAGLNDKNPAHKNVIKQLFKYNLIDEKLELINFKSPFEVPIQGTKEEEKEIEVVKEIEKDKKTIVFPFETDNFKLFWNEWKEYKKKEFGFKYKSYQSEQAALINLNNLSSNNEEVAIKIILKSIENGWKGFFELKTSTNINPEDEMEAYKRKVAEDLVNG